MRFDPLKKINNNTLVAFSVGVIFTILFNLIVNKEPFKVDSDSISALANVGTFLVAMVAALQVKKWLDGKVNEAAFKQTQLILEAISKIHMYSRLILEDCKALTQPDVVDALSYYLLDIKNNEARAINELNEKITQHNKIFKETSIQLQVLIYELPMWNISIKNKRVKKDILDIVAATKLFLEKCDEIEDQTNKKNVHNVITHARTISDE